MMTTREAIEKILPGAKIIRLKGFNQNTDYQAAKRAVDKWQQAPDLTDQEVETWLGLNGWVGAIVPEGRLIIDIDDNQAGKIVRDILEEKRSSYHAIKTPNGYQFIFKANQNQEIKQIAKFYTSIGLQVDTRIAGKGYIVFPTEGTVNRYILQENEGELSEPPRFLLPLKKVTTQEIYFPITADGSRHDTLYRFAACLRAWKVEPEEIVGNMQLIYDHLVLEKKDFSFSELESIISSAINWEPEFKEEYEIKIETDHVIPRPFKEKQNQLFKVVIRSDHGIEYEEEKRVSRMTPHITRELSDIEKNQIYYELVWSDRGEEKKTVVAASTISKKNDFLKLADQGFSVHELNYKDLITYFDQYILINRLDRQFMTDRLGWVAGRFIHPLDAEDMAIVPGPGEKRLFDAFKTKGTLESWQKEVFEKIKNHPKVLFMVFASLASVILKDIAVSPFIVDLSGSTSQGKSTGLQVARSVWGDSGLVNEWNVTRVSVERKAAFLNSFPLYMDDTRKADERILQSIIYQFSGGRSKGRGSLTGFQDESTWDNILISTGEVSLADFAEKAGGAVARVISLVDEPFLSVGHQYFSELYEALEANCGVLGLSFVKEWRKSKNKYIPSFKKVKEFYAEKSAGDEVVSRMSLFFASVHYAAAVARDIFNLEVDLKVLENLFDEIRQANEGLDKPREVLEHILSDLDRSRGEILYDDQFLDTGIKNMKAFYHKDNLYLTPAHLKDVLGVDNHLIRKEWLKKGLTIPGTDNDSSPRRVGSRIYRGVLINPAIVDELNYYFGRDEDIIPFPRQKL